MRTRPENWDHGLTRPMRVLFDLGHPAHFHLFRNTIEALRAGGHEALIIARQKDCLPELLRSARLPHQVVPRRVRGLTFVAAEQIRALELAVVLAHRQRVDFMVGTSVVVGLASRLTGSTSLVFCEDDADVVPLFSTLAYGPAHYVVTPRSLAHEAHGRKHLTYPGYHELAYLHPARYRPGPGVRKLLGLAPGQRYFVIRLVAMEAHHDIGQKGLIVERVKEVIRLLEPHGRVFISFEGNLPTEFSPYVLPVPVDRIFDVVRGADLIVGDSQTMAIEAAMLGTPSLRCNTFVGRLSVLEELEHRYGLTEGYRPEEFDRLLERLREWLRQPDLKAEFGRRRRRMLAECVDLTAWTLHLLGNLARRRAGLEDGRAAVRTGAPRPPSVPRHRRPRGGLEPFEQDALQEKYTTYNPAAQYLIRRFFDHLEELLGWTRGPILDAGAGEGDAYTFLPPHVVRRGIVALEVNPDCFPRMRRIVPGVRPVQGSVYRLPFADGAFETVLSMEVLEHLDDPEAGLRELLRVCRGSLILSVPREPLWRVGNFARGRYLRDFGNTPGHIQHWSREEFVQWVGKRARVREVRTPLPWTIVLAQVAPARAEAVPS